MGACLALLASSLAACSGLLSLALLEVVNGRSEEAHLLVIVRVQVLFDDSVRRLVLLEIEGDRIFKCHGLLILIWVAFHQLVELDALEGAHLPDVLLDRGEAAANTDHDLVGLDHQNTDLRSNHVLAFIGGWLLLKLDNGKHGKKHGVELVLVHDFEEFVLFEPGLSRLLTERLSLQVQLLLLGLKILRLVDFDHLFLNCLCTFKFKCGQRLEYFLIDWVLIALLCHLIQSCLLAEE